MLCWKGREATRKTWCRGEPPSGSPAKAPSPERLSETRGASLDLQRRSYYFVDCLFSVRPMIEGWCTEQAGSLQQLKSFRIWFQPEASSVPGALTDLSRHKR